MSWQLFVITQLSLLLVGLIAVFVLHQRALKRQILMLTHALEGSGGELLSAAVDDPRDSADPGEASTELVQDLMEDAVDDEEAPRALVEPTVTPDSTKDSPQDPQAAVEQDGADSSTPIDETDQPAESAAMLPDEIVAEDDDSSDKPAGEQGGLSELLRQLTRDNREMIHRIEALEAENEQLRTQLTGDAAA